MEENFTSKLHVTQRARFGNKINLGSILLLLLINGIFLGSQSTVPHLTEDMLYVTLPVERRTNTYLPQIGNPANRPESTDGIKVQPGEPMGITGVVLRSMGGVTAT